MEVIDIKSIPSRVKKVRKLLMSAGHQIGAVTFRKRTTGEKRKMAYRLHVSKPTYVKAPKGNKSQEIKARNEDKFQMIVFDVNKVLRNRLGRISGRGAYRTIPLENVERIRVNGVKYKIKVRKAVIKK